MRRSNNFKKWPSSRTFITKDETELRLKMLGYKIPQLKRYQLNENINNVLQLINVNTKNSDPFSKIKKY